MTEAQYEIISTDSMSELENIVTTEMSDGAVPVGGISTCFEADSGYVIFTQALLKQKRMVQAA